MTQHPDLLLWWWGLIGYGLELIELFYFTLGFRSLALLAI
jgi:hypothetical protein